MLRKILFIGLLFLGFSVNAGAETIYLKNGQVIKAEIVKDTGYSVQIMEKGFPKTFLMDDIDRIEQDNQALPEGALNTGEKEPLTEEKRQLIARLIDANGARESMNQTFAQILDSIPAEQKDQYRPLFKVDDIITRLTPIYAKYYTTQELQEIIAFYKSPAGQKHLQSTPLVLQESLKETIKYFQEKMPPKATTPAPLPTQ